MTFINAWIIFEETIVDRHGLWRYMPCGVTAVLTFPAGDWRGG